MKRVFVKMNNINNERMADWRNSFFSFFAERLQQQDCGFPEVLMYFNLYGHLTICDNFREVVKAPRI